MIYRRVLVGALRDSLRVIEKGLSPEERVVISKVQWGRVINPRVLPVVPAKR
jgi:hypothetical protein